MKKIGIITHYYRSMNYGGVLQSYALCAFLREKGYDCQQICYASSPKVDAKKNFKILVAQFLETLFFKRKWKKRRDAFSIFREQIPHSDVIYTKETIANSVDDYDVFITGSDQVWNLKNYHSAYFLDFVPSKKIKISYAASLCADALDENGKTIFQKSLGDFSAISVRENNAVELLTPLVSEKIDLVVDPVFLLKKTQWDALCGARMVRESYLFCYFLGGDQKARRLAQEFAKKKRLKIVTIPYIHQYLSKDTFADFGFGDVRLHDVSPMQFISLIKHADAVFTDSFHAVAFSTIYKKEFFVFERAGEKQMGSRIRSVVERVGAKEHFCTDENKNLDYLLGCVPIDYSENYKVTENMIEDSIRFLMRNIE